MITIKEEFLSSPKLRRAIELGGHEAVVLWLFLKGYAAANLTDGFIPDEELDAVPAWLVKEPRSLVEALRDCGKMKPDGTRGNGLVVPVDYGWQLHDYEDHANSQTEEELRREKARQKKAAQRAAKAAELAALQARGGRRKGTRRGQSRGQLGGQSEGHTSGHDGDNSGDVSRGHSPARGRGPAPARTHAQTQPSPTQPEDQTGEAAAEDLTGIPPREPPKPPRPPQPAVGELLSRLVSRPRIAGDAPYPRHDPMHEQVVFDRWAPSAEHLIWWRELGLDERNQDALLAAMREKHGAGDRRSFERWDTLCESYTRTQIDKARRQRSGAPPGWKPAGQPQRPPDHGKTGWE